MERALLLGALASTSCVVGENGSEPAPAGETYQLGGRTVDYFTKSPIGGIAFETLGLAPERMAASDLAGNFALTVPVGSSFFVRTAATPNSRPTIDDVVRTETADLAVFSRSDITRQHATAGVAVVPDTSTVFVELAAFDGAPIAAFARSNVSIVEPASQRVIASSPFVLGAVGDVDPKLETASGTIARFAFLNVPSGAYALVVACPTCQPAIATERTLIAGAGVSLVHVALGSQHGPPPDAFEAIYPLLQQGARGGLGCANCHRAGGSAVPAFEGPRAQVRDAILAASLVDIAQPDRSQLLVRPLYETPADHPNASFLSPSDPAYQTIRAWIAAGAE